MNCPVCGNEETKVVDSRSQAEKKKRRRSCPSCGHRFTTIEMHIEDYNGKQSAVKGLLELVEKHEREGKQWVKLSVLQAIKRLLD